MLEAGHLARAQHGLGGQALGEHRVQSLTHLTIKSFFTQMLLKFSYGINAVSVHWIVET